MNTFGKTTQQLQEDVDHLIRVLGNTCFCHAEENLEDPIWKTRDERWGELNDARWGKADEGEEAFLNQEMLGHDLEEHLNTLKQISFDMEAYFIRESIAFRDKIRDIQNVMVGCWKEEDVIQKVEEVGFREHRQDLEDKVKLYLNQEEAKLSQILDRMITTMIKTRLPLPPSSQPTCLPPEKKKTSISSVSTDTKRTSA